MIYTASFIIFWMCVYMRASGRGLGPGNREFFGPSEMASSREVSAIWGCINHRYIGGFMYKSPRGKFQGPYCGGGGGSRCKEFNRPARATPPHNKTY
jgi:hypothetical protein